MARNVGPTRSTILCKRGLTSLGVPAATYPGCYAFFRNREPFDQALLRDRFSNATLMVDRPQLAFDPGHCQ